MRVVVDLRPAHDGMTGIGRYAENLYRSLKTVVGLEVGAIAMTASPPWDDLALPDLLRRKGADIFHSPLFVLPKVRACRTIATIHDVIPLARPDLCPTAFREFFSTHIGRAIESADHIVTVSEFSKADIVRHLGVDPERVSAIPEPVSPLFAPQGRREEERYLLSVGAMDRRKNLARLLQAYALAMKVDPTVPSLVVVGGPSGDGFDIAAEIAAGALQDRVRLLGRVTDERLARLYAGAEALLFPSLYEGFGLPVVEAMASGSPVVASNTTSIPEVAGDAALLVDPENTEAIRDAILLILRDANLRRTLREKGLARAKEFSLERQGRRLVALYRRLVGPP